VRQHTTLYLLDSFKQNHFNFFSSVHDEYRTPLAELTCIIDGSCHNNVAHCSFIVMFIVAYSLYKLF